MAGVRPFSSAGIILSYKCSSRCRHCLYSCSSKWDGWITPENIERLYSGTIKALGDRSAVQGFHLAGGEAFLNYPLLLQAVELAREAGVPLDYVETNAHWFTDIDDAVEKLSGLKRAGLRCLLISASPQHLEHIPFRKTLGAIEASLMVFGQRGTFVWLQEFLGEISALGIDGTLPFDEYARLAGDRKARYAAVYGGQLVPGGRAAYRLSEYLPKKPLSKCLSDSCEHELLYSGHGHYDLYGNILPGSCTGISLGSAWNLPESIGEFTFYDKPILKVLVTKGTRGLLEFAVSEYGYIPSAEYVGKCHLCMDIRTHIVNHGESYKELTPVQFYQEI